MFTKSYNIQTGYLFDENGKKFDVSVILNFPTAADYEKSTGSNDFPETNLIDFYFGEPDENITEQYVKQFIDRQNKYQKLIQKLTELKALYPDDTEIDDQIEFIKSLIKTIH